MTNYTEQFKKFKKDKGIKDEEEIGNTIKGFVRWLMINHISIDIDDIRDFSRTLIEDKEV